MVVVEGLFALYWEEIRDLFHTRVFVAINDQVCLSRRIERDTKERGRSRESVLSQYRETVRPMNEEYILPTEIFADLVVNGENLLAQSAALITDYVRGIENSKPSSGIKMKEKETLSKKVGSQREELMEELYNRYGSKAGGQGGLGHRLRYWRKKYAWIVVVGGAKALKRFIDILASATLFLCLWPLFLGVALCIKLTDGGPVLFWQTRIGLWGKEFPFPKFRSMVVNAEALKDDILAQSDHEDSITFKMKKDPRVTWIGTIIRKLSIDELPQLWCVLRGDMSLVGPRPPVPREVAEYTLSDRRRLDAIPGLTCIWQVSGRGDIPFDEQVELDVQYIESQSIWVDIKLLFGTIPAVLLGKGAY